MADQPTHRILAGRAEYVAALHQAFDLVATHGCREVFISDPDFAEWPLGDAGVIERLTQWAMAHRQLTVLAQQYDEIVRRHPRWVTWRRQWSHVVECRAIETLEPRTLPTFFIAPGVVTVRLFDLAHHRGSLSFEIADEVRAREQLDAVLQQSELALPATTLGL